LLPDRQVPGTKELLRPEKLVVFDYRQAELRWIDQRWQLLAGGVWLKDFGRRESDARAALRTIQNLQLTQYGTVGTPQPAMEYWLSGGAAPQRLGGGGRVETLDLNTLRVAEVNGQWCLRDNRHTLFAFGPRRDDAEQALAIIHHHGFTHVGLIGPATSTMMYFMRGESGALHARADNKDDITPTNPATPGEAKTKPAEPAMNPGTMFPDKKAVPRPATPPEKIMFDYRLVQLRHDQNDWKLTAGSYVFANFGSDKLTAQQALNLFNYYRPTEQVLIGRPVPTFSYFLVGGQPPRGVKFGVPSDSFFPDSIVIRQIGSQWMVCEGERPLVNFGDKQDDARQLVEAIHRYRFDHLCRVGNGPGQSVTFLARGR
jgi:hypothetical protein